LIGAALAVAVTATAVLDPRLIAPALSGDPTSFSVWVELRDKGERSPSELEAVLAEAAASLGPRNRARRERAQVSPLVDYRDIPVHRAYLDTLEAHGFAVRAVSRWLNRVALRVPGRELLALAGLPFARRVVPVEWLRRSPEPSSPSPVPVRAPLGGSEYGLSFAQLAQLGIPAVHSVGYTGSGVLVCVLDDGFNYYDRHEALREIRVGPGHTRDFVDGDTTVTDTLAPFGLRHGTWTLAVIGGAKPGSYLGAAYGAEFALARVEADAFERRVEMTYWGMGAEWADSLGADVISSSLGYSRFDDPDSDYTYRDMDGHTTDVSRFAEIAASKGILVVNAAGNEGGTTWRHVIAPADVNGDSLIAVGAVDAAGTIGRFSSVGPSADGRIKPDLVARGVDNPLPAVDGDPHGYITNSGTSFAAPLVAGLAACLIGARPTWTPETVIRALRSTASRAGDPDTVYGYGIPEGWRALHWSATGFAAGALRVSLIGPNPFVARGGPVSVELGLGESVQAPVEGRLRVVDVHGRIVRGLWSGALQAAVPFRATWDGADDDGRDAPPGLYWLALEAVGRVAAARLVLLR